MQGALYGARAMASGFGPLVFAAIFAGFTRSDSPLPFYPGAPFILGAVLMVGTMALAGSLPADAGGNGGSLTLFRNMSGGVSMQRTGGRGKHGRDDPEAAAAEEEGLLGEGGGSGGESRPPSGEGTDHYDGRTDNQR